MLPGLIIHCFFKFVPGVVRYSHSSNTIVPCHQIVAVLEIPHAYLNFHADESFSIGYNLNNITHLLSFDSL